MTEIKDYYAEAANQLTKHSVQLACDGKVDDLLNLLHKNDIVEFSGAQTVVNGDFVRFPMLYEDRIQVLNSLMTALGKNNQVDTILELSRKLDFRPWGKSPFVDALRALGKAGHVDHLQEIDGQKINDNKVILIDRSRNDSRHPAEKGHIEPFMEAAGEAGQTEAIVNVIEKFYISSDNGAVTTALEAARKNEKAGTIAVIFDHYSIGPDDNEAQDMLQKVSNQHQDALYLQLQVWAAARNPQIDQSNEPDYPVEDITPPV